MAAATAAAVLAALTFSTAVAAVGTRVYPLHRNITATVFWIGEPVGNGSTENNAISAYDDRWLAHYGGADPVAPARKAPFFPPFRPHENPFYLDLPYDDFLNRGSPRPGRLAVVPWAADEVAQLSSARQAGVPFSLMKNRWVEIIRRGRACYGQIEDAGPYVYNDARYVFGAADQRPRSLRATNAGMDVSPALRDCLGFAGLNNDQNRVDWRFVERSRVPPGPWRLVVTTRQVFWP